MAVNIKYKVNNPFPFQIMLYISQLDFKSAVITNILFKNEHGGLPGSLRKKEQRESGTEDLKWAL